MPTTNHSKARPTSRVFSLKALSAAVLTATLFANAHAAGLGKLTVLSSLGQPLHAEIELTSVSKDELSTLAPRLASVDAFKQAGIDFNPVLFNLRFAVEQRAGRTFIRVTSPQPINEPFVDMLIELGGGNSRLIREYTFLLDPPDLRNSQSPQTAAPIVLPPAPLARREQAATPPAAQQAAPAETQQAPAARQPATPERPARATAPQPAAPAAPAEGSEHTVRRGDSLSKIAGQYRQPGVSLDQMLVALYRANPDAFIGNNMNRLRSGQILSVPNAEAAGAIAQREARGVVLAHAADFNNYRSKLAGQVAVAAPQKSAEPAQAATGKITARVEEQKTPANESKDKLKLSKSIAGAADKGGASEEDRIAKEKALAEANARVKELEKNVGDLQKLLEIKNKEMADRQKLADAAKGAAAAAAPAAAAPVAPAAPAPAPAPVASAPVASAPAASAPAASAPAAPAASAPAAKPAPKRVVAEDPSITDMLFDNPLIPAAVLTLLAGLGGFYVWRRRKQEAKPFEDSILSDSTLKTNSLFGSTGGQSVDTNNSIFNSSFAPSVSQLDSNEVDPVAEADVYIAYGRDAQAEEILKEALRTQPERHAVRVKLLEIYANRKDLRSFEVLATELYSMTKGEGEDWAQAAALGHGIDPKNPLYAGGKPAADSAAAAATAAVAAPAAAATPPADDLDLDTLLPMGDETAPSPAAEEPAPAEEAAPAEEPRAVANANELDFDLEGLSADSLDTPAPAAAAPAPMPEEIKSEIEDINFDFLDSPSTASATVEEPKAEEPVESKSDDMSLDMPSLDMPPLDIPAATPAPAAEMPALEIPSLDLPSEKKQDEPVPSLEMPSLDMRALDVPEPEPVAVAAAAPEMEPALAAVVTDNLDVAEEHPVAAPAVVTAAAKAEPEAMEFDLSGITLELNPEEGKSGLVQETYGVHDTGNAEDYSNNAEMATKLDLAVAYQEIGDKEGARELLEEVVKGGSPDQSEKARNLLAKLG